MEPEIYVGDVKEPLTATLKPSDKILDKEKMTNAGKSSSIEKSQKKPIQAKKGKINGRRASMQVMSMSKQTDLLNLLH